MLSQPKVDEAVRVVVTPSQAAYFAGERLSITITITNTRAPQATLQSYSASQSQSLHKRSAHSVSHVPMARPPTSPGTRTAGPVTSARPVPGGVVLVRRGTIGKTKPSKGVEESNESADQTRRRLLLNRSQSISLSTQDFRPDTQVDARGKSPLRTLRTLEAAVPSPTSSRLFSPLARSASVPAHHPHARKQSVSDVQVQLSPFDPAAPPLTPNASTYSLTLDPIAEGVTSPMPPQTPAISSPSSSVIFTHPPLPSSASAPTELRAATADTASRAGNSHQHVQSVLGRGPPPIIVQSPKPRASSSFITAPSNELVLYSYAQLSGTISIRPLADLPQTSDQIKALQSLRRSLLRSKAVGGGSMDITTHNSNTFTSGSHLPSPPHRSTHARSSSLSGSLLSVLSPSSHLPSAFPISSLDRTRRAARHGRSPSIFASIFQPAASSSSRMSGLGLSVNPSEEEDTDGDTPLPTFEVRPSMLAIDLNLSPGESRSYTYELDLPHNLPPSYRGRALKLSYEFVTGICRASSSASAGPESHSRVMKVPIRVYNNVAIGSPVATYDLLWPTAARNGVPSPQGSSTAVVTELRNSLKKYLSTNPPGLSPKLDRTRTAESVRMYARDLILHADSLGRLDDAPSYLSSEFRAAQNLHGDDMHFQGDISCREAVEVLTRNPKKLSFDVNKDGIKVAVLTFTKSAYRLGETVLGVVELNSRASRARVLKLSALLEAHESLPTCLAPPPPSTSRQMRRIHAEHHSSFMTSTMRTTFSLDIPPDASPTFRIAVPSYASGGSSYGGLEWKVRINLLVAVASPNAREGADGIRFKTLVVDGPRGEWGTTWTAARTIAPSERTSPLLATGDSLETPRATQSWTSFLTSTFLGSTEPVDQYHDGDEEVDEEGHEHDDEGEWKEVKVEMVECEVPIKVWPGNTAFKASEVVFEV